MQGLERFGVRQILDANADRARLRLRGEADAGREFVSVATMLTDILPSAAISGERVTGPWQRLGIEPEAIVHPESVEEVSAALRWAGASGVRIIAVGSGCHLPALWQEGRFVVLSTTRLTGIEIYEPADLTLTARSGTSLADIDAELRTHRQWLPFDPPHVLDRTLGGFVATGQSSACRQRLPGLASSPTAPIA